MNHELRIMNNVKIKIFFLIIFFSLFSLAENSRAAIIFSDDFNYSQDWDGRTDQVSVLTAMSPSNTWSGVWCNPQTNENYSAVSSSFGYSGKGVKFHMENNGCGAPEVAQEACWFKNATQNTLQQPILFWGYRFRLSTTDLGNFAGKSLKLTRFYPTPDSSSPSIIPVISDSGGWPNPSGLQFNVAGNWIGYYIADTDWHTYIWEFDHGNNNNDDGVIRLWVDGDLKFEKLDVNWGGSGENFTYTAFPALQGNLSGNFDGGVLETFWDDYVWATTKEEIDGFLATEPNITNVSGTLNHGNSITISGSGFGTKSPVAPLIWDNGSSRASGEAPSAGGWTAAYPTGLTGESAIYNMQYRTAGDFRNVYGPHSLNTRYLAGCSVGYSDYGGVNGANAVVGKKFTVTSDQHWFASTYWRLDPSGLHDWESYPYTNIKNFQYCSDGPVCDTDPLILLTWAYGGGWLTYAPILCGGSSWCAGGYGDARNKWIKTEIQAISESANSVVQLWDDGVLRIDGVGDVTGMEGISRYFSFGGYWSPRYSNHEALSEPFTNNYRYFADMYLDNTWARIIIGNSPTYDSCTIKEIQPPTAWNDNGQLITVTLNRGSFGISDAAYLYVINSEGAISDVTATKGAQGYPITFGSSGGDATAPTSPSGLSVS